MIDKYCNIIQDLLPSYTEELVSDDTKQMVDEHVSQCEQCYHMYLRMKKNVTLESDNIKPDKKTTLYISSLRIWYFVCPFLAFALLYFNLEILWHMYEGLLVLITVICISSQFFAGSTQYGFDWEQVKKQQESEQLGKKKWGKYYASPLKICLPALIIVVVTFSVRFIEFLIGALK